MFAGKQADGNQDLLRNIVYENNIEETIGKYYLWRVWVEYYIQSVLHYQSCGGHVSH